MTTHVTFVALLIAPRRYAASGQLPLLLLWGGGLFSKLAQDQPYYTECPAHFYSVSWNKQLLPQLSWLHLGTNFLSCTCGFS